MPGFRGIPGARPRRRGGGFDVTLLVASSRTVYGCGPSLEEPVRALVSFHDGELGYLRSARVVPGGGVSSLLLAGAQRGLYVTPLDRPGAPPEVYPLPRGRRSRRGVNSAVLVGDRLLASHSAFGVVAWRRGCEDPPRLVFDAVKENASSVREVQRLPDGRVVFAAGSDLRTLSPEASPASSDVIASAPREITALEARPGGVVVGTRDGRLLAWDDGDHDLREIARWGPHPVSAVRAASFQGKPYYVVAAKLSGVHASDYDGLEETFYCAQERIRWVAATCDAIFGVEESGRRVLVWSWTRRDRPAGYWTFREPVEALSVSIS